MSSCRFLFANGVLLPPSDAPPVSTFLEAHSGAYTTTRTGNNGSHVLFWERHVRRLADSINILFDSSPKLLFGSEESVVSLTSHSLRPLRWDSVIRSLFSDSMSKALPMALGKRSSGEELAITALVSANLEKLGEIESGDEQRIFRAFDAYIHIGAYIPPPFGTRENGAHLAVVGRGRDVANAKYSEWVKLRRSLEKLRPPSATELLLSNDGDRILEGCITNFFVVCRKTNDDYRSDDKADNLPGRSSLDSFEIQTARITDGVLPGVIRQVIIDICLSYGISFREVAPSWSERESWEEAFITNSLRLLQHVETIRVPSSFDSLHSESWKEVRWEDKHFKEGPGMVTAMIQKEIVKRAGVEGYPVTLFNGL